MEATNFSSINQVSIPFLMNGNENNKLKEIAKNLGIHVDANDDIKVIERKILSFAKSDYKKLKQLDGDQVPSFFKSILKLSALYQRKCIIRDDDLLLNISLQLISMGFFEEAFDPEFTDGYAGMSTKEDVLYKMLRRLSYKDEENIYRILPLISNEKKQALALNSLYPSNGGGPYIEDKFNDEESSEDLDGIGIDAKNVKPFLSFVDRLPAKFDEVKDNLYRKLAGGMGLFNQEDLFFSIDIGNRIKNADARKSAFRFIYGDPDCHSFSQYWLGTVKSSLDVAFNLIEKINDTSSKHMFFLDLLYHLYFEESPLSQEIKFPKIRVPIERLDEVIALFKNVVGNFIPAFNVIERVADASLKGALMGGYAMECAAAGRFKVCRGLSERDMNSTIMLYLNSPSFNQNQRTIQSLNLIASENPELGQRTLSSLSSGTFDAATAVLLLSPKSAGSWLVRYSSRTKSYVVCFKQRNAQISQQAIGVLDSLNMWENQLHRVFPESLRIEAKTVTSFVS